MNRRLPTRPPGRPLIRTAFACGGAIVLLLGPGVMGQPAPGTGTGARPAGAATAPATLPKAPTPPIPDQKAGDKPIDVDALNKFVRENVRRLSTTDDSEGMINSAMTAKMDLIF